MCGKKPAPTPQVIQRDPVADQAKAEAEAQTTANTELAQRRRRRSWSASLSQAGSRGALLGGGSVDQGHSLLAQARPEG